MFVHALLVFVSFGPYPFCKRKVRKGRYQVAGVRKFARFCRMPLSKTKITVKIGARKQSEVLQSTIGAFEQIVALLYGVLQLIGTAALPSIIWTACGSHTSVNRCPNQQQQKF